MKRKIKIEEIKPPPVTAFEKTEAQAPTIDPLNDPMDTAAKFEDIRKITELPIIGRPIEDYGDLKDHDHGDNNDSDSNIGNKGNHDSGTGLGNRRQGAKIIGDLTPASESAVDKALRWLADHQLPDGSWNFDHTGGKCKGRCKNSGSFSAAKNGATALAILPFLGAGHTHLEGKHQETVTRGLLYLIKTAKVSNYSADWREVQGTSYSHGLVVLALCEAYGMSKNYRPKSFSEMTKREQK